MSEVKFIHLRNFNADGSVATRGGITIAYREERDDNGPVARYAAAYCSERDNYCRSTGRAIAQGRLDSKKGIPHHVFLLAGEKAHEELIRLFNNSEEATEEDFANLITDEATQ